MKCDWIFLSQDRSRHEETHDDQKLPELGDGRIRNDKGYEVVLVVTNRVAQPNPLILAVEWAK